MNEFTKNIIFNTKEKAEKTLDCMKDIVKTYGYVTKADLYDLIECKAAWYDNKCGWVDLSGAYIEEVKHGYVIVLMDPIPIAFS